MAEVDTSIYKSAQAPDPLGNVRNFVDLSTAIAQNRLAQMEALGKVAGGHILQESLTPSGGYDYNALVTRLRNDPNGWAAAPAVLPGAISMQGGALANARTKQDLNQAGFENLGATWGARLAQGTGPIDPRDLEKDVFGLVAQGRMAPDLGMAIVRGMPSDPAEARAYAAGGYVSSLPPQFAASPAPATPGPGGAPRQQTQGQFVTESTGGGRAAPVEPAGGVITGLTPAAAAAQPVSGDFNAKQGNAILALGNDVPNRLSLLNNMESEAAEMGSLAGPVSDQLANTIATANQLFGTSIDLKGVAAKDRFDKIASQIALAQSGALGISDLTTRTSMGANPHSSMSPLGIQGNIALLKGNELAIQAKSRAYQQYLDNGGTPDQYSKWSLEFNRHYDPRVFQTAYLDNEQVQQLFKTMSKDELAKFRNDYNFAARNGWIPARSAASPPPAPFPTGKFSPVPPRPAQ